MFRLKAGSGPIHLSGQHLVSKCFSEDGSFICPSVGLHSSHHLLSNLLSVMEADQSFEEEDDEEEEEEEVKTSKKRPASSPAAKSQV